MGLSYDYDTLCRYCDRRVYRDGLCEQDWWERHGNGAIVSDCGRYRYKLTRRWGAAEPALFLMLNPSTADASADDPTVRKCCGFAWRWGCGGIVVCNVFAWRATKPRDLPQDVAEAEGPLNRETVVDAVQQAVDAGAPVVAAWGGHLPWSDAQRFLGWLDQGVVGARLQCLGFTKATKQPRHPLMLSYATTLQPYPEARGEEGDE